MAEVNIAYCAKFTAPSLTGIGVAALALPDLQIELELTVRLPDCLTLRKDSQATHSASLKT